MKEQSLKYYPDQQDPSINEVIYDKLEFYKNRIRPDMFEGKSMEELCNPVGSYKLQPYQLLARTLISPERPFDKLFLWYGTGVGKCLHPDSMVYIGASSIKDRFSGTEPPLQLDRELSVMTMEEIWHKYTNGKDEIEGFIKPTTHFSVISYDKKNNKPIYTFVKNLYRQYVEEALYVITLGDGTVVKVTQSHHLYTLAKGWKAMPKIGEYILTVMGYKRICDVYFEYYKGYVYDFEVPVYHNYFGVDALYHNTCTGVVIAEPFKKQMRTLHDNGQEGYIYIITNKESQELFRRELIGNCGTLANGLSIEDENPYVSNAEKRELEELAKLKDKAGIEKYKKAKRAYIKNRLEKPSKGGYYRFRSYSKFAIDVNNGKIKNVDNCVVLLDEGHNLLNENEWQQAYTKVLAKSKNVREVVLSATPMVNNPSQIVEFINLLLYNDPLVKGEIFKSDNELTPNGLKILQEKTRGLVSYIRGNNPYTFPQVIEEGTICPGKYIDTKGIEYKFKYTKLVRCPMSELHYRTYLKNWDGAMRQELKQLMDMVFPDPENPKVGIFSEKQLLYEKYVNNPKILEKYGIELIPDVFGRKVGNKIKYQVSGDILKMENLRKYSTKFYIALQNINEEVGLKNGLIYINSKFVHGTGGIKMFSQILNRNGYEELNTYQYNLPAHSQGTKCYFCGIPQGKHKEHKGHEYYPVRYALLHKDINPDERTRIQELFNSKENKDGRIVKILLAANIGKESIDLKRVQYIHILNYQENFSKTNQIIGRGARYCSHKDLGKEHRFVHVYKYVSSLPGKQFGKELSAEEIEYAKDENNYIVMKKIERAIKVGAIDCSLNKAVNVFKKEIDANKGCIEADHYKPGKGKLCSPLCDFMGCNYKCSYEPKGPGGKDTSTYKLLYHNEEVAAAYNFIRALFRRDIAWDFEGICAAFGGDPDYELVDQSYIILALDKLLGDQITVFNPSGEKGNITFVGNYYVFKPLGKDNKVTINERMIKGEEVSNVINLNDYAERCERSKMKEEEKKVLDIKEIFKIIRREQGSDGKSAKKKIYKMLAQYPIGLQQKILEKAIEEYYNGYMHQKPTPQEYIKVLKNYKAILINKDQYDDNSDYSKEFSLVEDTSSTSGSAGATKNIIVGHFLLDVPRCYDSGIWQNCDSSVKYKVRKYKEKENNIIIGFMDKDAHGRMVFKLRNVMKPGEIITDKRRMRKGFQCGQVNDKSMLLDICNKLGIKVERNLKINYICVLIEDELRRKQKISRERGQGIRWFYEYIDLHRYNV
jgi:hypothetical protein